MIGLRYLQWIQSLKNRTSNKDVHCDHFQEGSYANQQTELKCHMIWILTHKLSVINCYLPFLPCQCNRDRIQWHRKLNLIARGVFDIRASQQDREGRVEVILLWRVSQVGIHYRLSFWNFSCYPMAFCKCAQDITRSRIDLKHLVHLNIHFYNR